MLLVRSSEFPGPKVMLVLGEARTAPENFLQEIGLRESAGCAEESDRPTETQDCIGILTEDVEVADGDRHICHNEVLRDVSDPNGAGPVDRPGVWHEPEEDAEKGRLPGAVRADDRERGPSSHMEADVFQNRDVVQSHPEVRNPEDVCLGAGVAARTS